VTKRNSEIVRQLYGAFNEADWASATALADPDLVWVPDPRVGVGPIEGADDALRFFRDRAEMFDEFRIEVERLEEAGNKVVAMLRTSGRGEASGAEFEIRVDHVWTLRDGVVIRGEGYGDRDEALKAAGLNP